MKWGKPTWATFRCTVCKKLMNLREGSQPFFCPRCDTGTLIRLGRPPTQRELDEHETHESLR